MEQSYLCEASGLCECHGGWDRDRGGCLNGAAWKGKRRGAKKFLPCLRGPFDLPYMVDVKEAQKTRARSWSPSLGVATGLRSWQKTRPGRIVALRYNTGLQRIARAPQQQGSFRSP